MGNMITNILLFLILLEIPGIRGIESELRDIKQELYKIRRGIERSED